MGHRATADNRMMCNDIYISPGMIVRTAKQCKADVPSTSVRAPQKSDSSSLPQPCLHDSVLFPRASSFEPDIRRVEACEYAIRDRYLKSGQPHARRDRDCKCREIYGILILPSRVRLNRHQIDRGGSIQAHGSEM